MEPVTEEPFEDLYNTIYIAQDSDIIEDNEDNTDKETMVIVFGRFAAT